MCEEEWVAIFIILEDFYNLETHPHIYKLNALALL